VDEQTRFNQTWYVSGAVFNTTVFFKERLPIIAIVFYSNVFIDFLRRFYNHI